jgi:uncharacterized protein (DUF608 family)
MVQIRETIKHNSGIPLGGVGTGSVEIRPDGLFHEWLIFNAGQWSPQSPCCREKLSVSGDALTFAIRTEAVNGEVVHRYLALSQPLTELYSLSWLRCVQSILFDGRFPIAYLTYEDGSLPVRVEAEIFSPFIPNDSRSSGTPGFYVHFILTNSSERNVKVSLLGSLRNLVGLDQDIRIPRNRIVRDESAVMISLGADGLDKDACSSGDMAFAVTGGKISYITGGFSARHLIRFWHPPYGLKVHTYLNLFRDNGCLPNSDAESRPSLPEDFRAADLSMEQCSQLLADMLRHPYVFEKFHRIRRIYPDLEQNRERLVEFLDSLSVDLQELKNSEWGEAALCSQIELPPGAKKSVLFVVSWYFPNHISPTGVRLGHMYENWYANAVDVGHFLLQNFGKFREKTRLLPELLYSSSLDPVVADAISSQLGTLVKCTWWTKEGHFGVWEGLGCCGFHTTDITYQGSFPLIALFPDLQMTQMTHGAKFQRDDGRVHHLFYPDFSAVDEGFDRVDMNPQFVMLAARDYLWTGDKGYLQTLWPHIVRAMDNSEELDKDGDGLPDHDTKRNTYDVWDFCGCPSYISSLWLGALKAAARLADEMGESDRADYWRGLYERGVRSLESKLWNGRYYMLWRDDVSGIVDEACMSDQMSGDWFCGVMGWGAICRPARIRRALKSIVEYNFKPSVGLINASYPPGVPHRVAASGNMQAEATWTGIEYTVAALLILHGMLGEGLAIVRDIHNRYLQSGRFWNHVECGDHYYRAMSSWTLLLAFSGFCLDVPNSRLSFRPVDMSDACVYPFFAPGLVGLYSQVLGIENNLVKIEVLEGAVALKHLEIPDIFKGKDVAVQMNDTVLEPSILAKEGLLELEFHPVAVLNATDVLTVRIG